METCTTFRPHLDFIRLEFIVTKPAVLSVAVLYSLLANTYNSHKLENLTKETTLPFMKSIKKCVNSNILKKRRLTILDEQLLC